MFWVAGIGITAALGLVSWAGTELHAPLAWWFLVALLALATQVWWIVAVLRCASNVEHKAWGYAAGGLALLNGLGLLGQVIEITSYLGQ